MTKKANNSGGGALLLGGFLALVILGLIIRAIEFVGNNLFVVMVLAALVGGALYAGKRFTDWLDVRDAADREAGELVERAWLQHYDYLDGKDDGIYGAHKPHVLD